MKRRLVLPLVGALVAGLALVSLPADGAGSGTPFGAQPWLVDDLEPGAGSANIQQNRIATLGDRLVFAANLTDTGLELFSTDGTAAGLRQLTDFPGNLGASPDPPVVAGNKIFFGALDAASDKELWVSDGTTAGTHRIEDINVGANSNPSPITAYGSKVVFMATVASKRQLWISDGTPAGTHAVGTGLPVAFSSTSRIVVLGSKVVFGADDGSTGMEPWVWTGGAAQPTRIADLEAGPTGSGFLNVSGAVMNGWVYVSAHTSVYGTEVYRTDGNVVALVRDINPGGGADSQPEGFTAAGSLVYFGAVNASDGYELWVTDGTTGGTVMLRDINLGGNSFPSGFVAFGNKVVFVASDNDHGREVWISGGSPANTRLVKDIDPGTDNGNTSGRFFPMSGQLWFAANDGVHGSELWRTDGTTAGTVRAPEFSVGATDGVSTPLGVVGNTFFAIGSDVVHGLEMHAFTARSSTTKAMPKSSYTKATAAAKKIVVPVAVKITGTKAIGKVTIKRNGVVWGTAKVVNGVAKVRLTKVLGKGVFTGFKAFYSGSVRGRLSHSAGFTVRVTT